jgi:hypothetical protein
MSGLARLYETLDLARVALRHLRVPGEHRAITCEFLKRRVFWSRRRRIEAWKKEMLAQFPMLLTTRIRPHA